MFQNVEVEEEHADERSVDDLLSFINGNDEGKAFISLLLLSLLRSVEVFLFYNYLWMT